MKRTVMLVAALLLSILPARAAGLQEDSRSSSDTPAQGAPSPAETSHSTSDQPAPASTTDQAQSAAKPEPTPPAAKSEKTAPQKPARPSAGVRKRRSGVKKPPDVAAVTGEPRKTVIHQGSISEPVAQIMPGITQEEANRQRQEAEQLLAEADSDLRQLATRSLSPNRQETVSQIRHYMDVARAALKDGDTQRAHTLAVKAHLLSDDLLKH